VLVASKNERSTTSWGAARSVSGIQSILNQAAGGTWILKKKSKSRLGVNRDLGEILSACNVVMQFSLACNTRKCMVCRFVAVLQHHEAGAWGRSTYLYGELPHNGKGAPVKYTGALFLWFVEDCNKSIIALWSHRSSDTVCSISLQLAVRRSTGEVVASRTRIPLTDLADLHATVKCLNSLYG